MKVLMDFIKHSGINQKNWLNPLLLGILPAIVVIWLQPIKFSKFLFSAIESSDYIIWFEDINDDGPKERFELRPNMANNASIFFFNDEAKLIDQQNFSFPLAKPYTKRKPYAVDFNKDGIKEIIIFTQNNDSLFLNVFDYAKNSIDIENIFVTTIGGFNDKKDYYLNWIGQHDINNDSIPEFYFSVAGGFALYPRRIFRYDYKNNSLISSVNTGAGNLYGTLFLDGDSVSIIASGAAYGNTRKSYPYPYQDSTSWLFYFDKDLKLRNPPKSYGGYPGYIGQIFQADSFAYFVYAANNISEEKSKLLKMNREGEIVDSIIFDYKVGSSIFSYNINGEKRYYFQKDNGQPLFIDTENFAVYSLNQLNFTKRMNLIGLIDFASNTNNDYLFYDYFKRELILFDKNFRNPFVISSESYVQFLTSNYYPALGYGELVINTDDHSKIYHYRINPNQYYKYPIWVAIYFLSVLFISFILFVQNQRIKKQRQLEQQLADLQLQNLRNQLDPHFTFNVLNTIGSYIYKQDKEMAYDLFQRFTRIIRSSLLGSDRIFWSLKEEIQFTQDYLEFQKLRFKERFRYTMNIDEGIEPDKIQFPKMLIQGFAENAVKHAFYGVKYIGNIYIIISKQADLFSIIVEDDGIGINKSKLQKGTSGTQKGINILEEQVLMINKFYNTNYVISLEDKIKLNHDKTGTKVTISSTLI